MKVLIVKTVYVRNDLDNDVVPKMQQAISWTMVNNAVTPHTLIWQHLLTH